MTQQVYQIQTSTYGNLVTIDFDGNTYNLSDHNRDPIDIIIDRIEVTRRTAKGQRRRYHIADKTSFNINWAMLPGRSTQTVDAGLGAEDLEEMYNATLALDEVDVTLVNADLTSTVYSMHLTSFSKTIAKRFDSGYYYQVSLGLEEV